jgi:hypothetical protein
MPSPLQGRARRVGVEAFFVEEEEVGAEGEEHDGDAGSDAEAGDYRRGSRKEKERFLSAQADRFAGAKREEKIGLLRSK